MEEIFVPLKIKNFEDCKISNYGRFMSPKGKMRKLKFLQGTWRIDIIKKRGGREVARLANFSIAKLVYTHFAEKVPSGEFYVHYKDGDHNNLRFDNLAISIGEPTQEQIDIYNKGVYACVKHAVRNSGFYYLKKDGLDIDNIIAQSCFLAWKHLAIFDGRNFYGFCKMCVKYACLKEYRNFKVMRYYDTLSI